MGVKKGNTKHGGIEMGSNLKEKARRLTSYADTRIVHRRGLFAIGVVNHNGEEIERIWLGHG